MGELIYLSQWRNQLSLFNGQLAWNNEQVEHPVVENRITPLILACGKWVLCAVVEDGWQWQGDGPDEQGGL